MKTLGIDLGSREVKIVIMNNMKMLYKNKISTMKFYRNYCTYNLRNKKLEVNLEKLGILNKSKSDPCHTFCIDAAVSTGYGRNNTSLEMFKPINEIKAHVYGALFQTDLKNFTLLDVGGQDVKAVKVENGILTDLELNEKCAASCGRYLENMAKVLEVPLKELFLHYENPVILNSTCSVFSESELIGKIAEGVKTEHLCAGVNYSLYKRLKPMLTRFIGKRLVLSGGVSKNSALVKFLKNDFDEVTCLKNAQFNGAIGCCYYAEKTNKTK